MSGYQYQHNFEGCECIDFHTCHCDCHVTQKDNPPKGRTAEEVVEIITGKDCPSAEVSERCGCKINHVGEYDREEGIDPTLSTIVYCPLHKVAPELLTDLKWHHLENYHAQEPIPGCTSCDLISRAEALT